MMTLLLLIIVVLAVRGMTLPGGTEGIKFYLLPDVQRMREVGIVETVTAAMNQAFFTLYRQGPHPAWRISKHCHSGYLCCPRVGAHHFSDLLFL